MDLLRGPRSSQTSDVICPRLGGSSHYWRSTATAFSESFHCLIYDLRGFGRSELPVDYSGDYALDDYALDLEVLLRQLDINGKMILMPIPWGLPSGQFLRRSFPNA